MWGNTEKPNLQCINKEVGFHAKDIANIFNKSTIEMFLNIEKDINQDKIGLQNIIQTVQQKKFL